MTRFAAWVDGESALPLDRSALGLPDDAAPSVTVADAVDQNFEGTGFDHGESWVNYGGAAGAADPDYAAAPLRGSQSLHMQDDPTDGTYAATKWADDTGVPSVGLAFMLRILDYPSGIAYGHAELAQLYNIQGSLGAPSSVTPHEVFNICADGRLRVSNWDSNVATSTAVLALDTTYYVWISVTRSTLTDGSGWIKVATTPEMPADNFLEWSGHEVTGDVNVNGLGFTTLHDEGYEFLVDQVKLNVSTIPTLEAGNASTVSLAVADAAAATSVETPSLTQANTLVVADASAAVAAENVGLSPGYTLALADATVAIAGDTPALTQSNVLAVADAAVATASETPGLAQANTLVPADASVAIAADSPSPTQANTLALDDAAVATAAESPSLAQANVLALDEAMVAVSADLVTLDITNAPTLAPDDAVVAATADAPSLTQANILVAADVSIAATAGTPTLGQANLLAVADTLLALSAESPVLTQANLLSVANALIALTTGTPTLLQAQLLAPADVLVASTADVPALHQAQRLSIDDAHVAVEAEAVALVQTNLLAVADALIALVAESPDIVPIADALAVADALILLAADQPTLVAHISRRIAGDVHLRATYSGDLRARPRATAALTTSYDGGT